MDVGSEYWGWVFIDIEMNKRISQPNISNYIIFFIKTFRNFSPSREQIKCIFYTWTLQICLGIFHIKFQVIGTHESPRKYWIPTSDCTGSWPLSLTLLGGRSPSSILLCLFFSYSSSIPIAWVRLLGLYWSSKIYLHQEKCRKYQPTFLK